MRKVLWIGMSLYLLAWTNMLAAKVQPVTQPNAASPRAAEKPLVFIAPVDYEPWVMIDAKGKVTGGILYETAHAIGVMVGLAVQVEAIPFPRFESLISQQDFDFTFVNQHQAMTGGVIFPKAISITQLGLIYLKKNKIFADCAKMKSIAHTSQNSDALQTLIQQKCGQVNLVNTNKLRQRFKMLGFGRVDAFLGSNEEMDLVGWFGESCDSLGFVSFFDMNWHIFASNKSRLTQEPYRSRLEHFIATYEPELYHVIRKKVLGDRYCPTVRLL